MGNRKTYTKLNTSNISKYSMDKMSSGSSRRSAFKKIAGTTAAALAGTAISQRLSAAESQLEEKLKGKVNHSVCRWCYNSIPLEDLCKAANQIGLTSIELTGPEEWPLLKKYGLTSALPNGAGKGIEKRSEEHTSELQSRLHLVCRL